MTAPAAAPQWGRKARVGVASTVGLQLLIVAALVVAANWMSSRHYRRLDWTEEASYSLGAKTTQLLERISEGDATFQVVVFYLPDNEGAWEAAVKRTQDLLEEYKTRSRGRINFEVVPLAEVGDVGVSSAKKKYGIQSPIGRNDVLFKKGAAERTVNLGEFFGQSWDDVAQGQPARLTTFNGEAIVTSTLQVMAQDRPVVLGFTTGHDEADPEDVRTPGQWGYFGTQVLQQREGYAVRKIQIPVGGSISREVDVVVIAGPMHDFNEGETNALKVYLAAGGRLFLTLDSAFERSAPLPNLFNFLAAYGIKPQLDTVLDPPNSVDEWRQGESEIKKFQMPFQILVRSFDLKHPITAKFEEREALMLGACGILTDPQSVPEGMKIWELAHCGPDGWGEKDFPSDKQYTPNRDEPGPLAVAAAVAGTGKAMASGDEARIVVLGDSTSLSNVGISNRIPPDLALNSIRWLARQEYLISIEGKRHEDRSLLLSDDQSAHVFRVCVLFLPGLALAFGVTMYLTRRAQ